MPNQIQYFISANSISFYTSDGTAYNIASDHLNYKVIAKTLMDGLYDEEDIIEMVNVEYTVVKSIDAAVAGRYLTAGKVTVLNGEIFYDGVPMRSALTEKMLGVLAENGNINPWCFFAEKLMTNPSPSTRDELYDWISNCKMPITEDGDLVAYKRVGQEYKDLHSNTILNTVGTTVQLEDRTKVDPNRQNTCSVGLHFCSPTYLSQFWNNRGRIMVLTVDPSDVVSIPADYNFAKGRTWKYSVVAEITQNEAERVEWPAVVPTSALSNETKRAKYYKAALPVKQDTASSAFM